MIFPIVMAGILAGSTAAPAPQLPSGEDEFIALVVEHCLPEKLNDRPPTPPIDGSPTTPADRKPGWLKLSDQARLVATSNGRVVLDHDANYCRVIAHDLEGAAIERRLAARLNSPPFTSSQTNDHWRDGLTTMRDVEFSLTSHATAVRTPIVLLDYPARSGSWVEAYVGFSYPADEASLRNAVP